MSKQFHILNGDALKEQFPQDVPGEQIVLRECFVDGPVDANTLEELYEIRSKFIVDNYEGTVQEYSEKVIPEFNKITSLHENCDVNLWFEDDLFCQVNFWFTIHLLQLKKCNTFLIRPVKHNQYGFGGLDQKELNALFENRLPLRELNELAPFWDLYRSGNLNEMLRLAEKLKPKYPFMLPAINAHIERIPEDGYLGRPKESLKEIMKELQTDKFGPVFQEFCKRESIYGFGDLQVKRLYDEVLNR